MRQTRTAKRFLMKVYSIIGCVVFILSGIIWVQKQQIESYKEKATVYQNNTHALLSQIETYQIDSTKTASTIHTLKLSIDELKEYREKDLKTIEELEMNIKDLKSYSSAQYTVQAEMIAALQDTIVYKDSVLTEAKKFEFVNDHIDFSGMISGGELQSSLKMNVKIDQAIVPIYKWKFLWFKGPVKSIKQVIVTDNPYIKLDYAEYIFIE